MIPRSSEKNNGNDGEFDHRGAELPGFDVAEKWHRSVMALQHLFHRGADRAELDIRHHERTNGVECVRRRVRPADRHGDQIDYRSRALCRWVIRGQARHRKR